jgi:hypothetical protein
MPTAVQAANDVVTEVLRDAARAPDPVAAVRADPRLGDVTVYQDVDCGPNLTSLTPHQVSGHGCPACPHPTSQVPLSQVLDNYPADQQLQILEGLQSHPTGISLPKPPPGTSVLTSVVTTATGLLLAVSVIAAAVGVGRNGADFRDHLKEPCPPAATRQVGNPSGPTVGCSSTVPVDDGSGDILQTVDLVMPATITVGFRFCDGLSCGDADPECYSNQWIPSFGGENLSRMTIAPPPGARAAGVVAGAGSSAGSLSQLAATPTIGADGSVTVSVPSPTRSAIASRFHDGKICGFSEDEKRAIEERLGSSYDNSAQRVVRVVIRWKGASAGASPPPVRINNSQDLGL